MAIAIPVGGADERTAMHTTLDKIIALGHSRIVTEHTAIHRAGERFRSIFYLQSGLAQRSLVQDDGCVQTLGFALPGELVGIEGFNSFAHSTTVITLDLCALVEIPSDALQQLADHDPTVARFLLRNVSAALRDEHGWLAAIGLLNADERLATFLLDLSQRFASRGYSSNRFMLRMTGTEIGCFLGLTLETVRRVFSRFQKLGLLKASDWEIELRDVSALAALAQVRSTKQGREALMLPCGGH
jgi:CRP/FNR family transcriptional regulator, anaerobic regulatory protein